MDDSNAIRHFLLGLGIGTAIGFLFAPKSGSEARDFLNLKGRSAADRVRRHGENLRDRAKDGLERGKQRVQEQAKEMSDALDAGKQALHETVNEISRA